MPKVRRSIRFEGADARRFVCMMMDNERLQKESTNEHLAPEMKQAVMDEMARRDLLPGNYQI